MYLEKKYLRLFFILLAVTLLGFGTGLFILKCKDICAQIYSPVTYYVSSSGNDLNNGTSPDTPWKTIFKVNQTNFNPGDSILFKRGDVWREQLIVSSSGAKDRLIIFGAYGEGEKPKITGVDLASGWVESGENGEYFIENITDPVFIFMKNGVVVLRGSAKGSLVQDTWYYASALHRLYYKPPAEHKPEEYLIEYGIRSSAILVISKSYIIFNDLRTEGSNSAWNSEIKANLHISNSDNIIVDGCEFFNSGTFGIRVQDGSSHIFVRNCEAKYCASRGITFEDVSDGIISNCVSHDNGKNWYNLLVDMEGIAIGPECSDIIVENNETYENGQEGSPIKNKGAGIVLYIPKGKIIIRNNKIHDNYEYGISIGGANGPIDINHNLIYGNGKNSMPNDSWWAGIYLSYWGPMQNLVNVNISNNTIWRNDGRHESENNWSFRSGNLVVNLGPGNSINLELKNNIIGEFLASRPGYNISYVINKEANNFSLISDNNDIYCTAGNCINWTQFGVNNIWDFDHIIGKTSGYYLFDKSQDANSLSENPLFVNPASDNFYLQSDSPCVDKGLDIGLSQDFDGNRIVGLPDIGVFEYQPLVVFEKEDIDQDKTVGFSDFNLIIQNFKKQKSQLQNSNTDVNSDGIVDAKDLALVMRKWGTSY